MSTYRDMMGELFPHVVTASHGQIREFVAMLLDADRKDVIQGSSFAVTVDNWDGTWNLWLSQASCKYLKARCPMLQSGDNGVDVS